MAYTVKQVATMSKISVRTLHFYDESGLLKPAYYNDNGYRFYEEPQRTDANQICLRIRAGHQTQTRAGAVWASSLKRNRTRYGKDSKSDTVGQIPCLLRPKFAGVCPVSGPD